jgi:glycosyltransferase involved in cell wall biosynthesis
VPVTWIASSLFDHGGAPDRLERHPVRSLAAAALVSARLTLVVARRAARWDSIIAHWLVPSAIAALPARVPLLAIAHGGDIHTLRRMRLLAPVLHALYHRDAQLVFVSEPLRAIARDAAPRLAAWLDTATIQPMGLDLARFRRVGHTPTRPPTIVIAARLVDIKGVDVAIDALAHLRAPVRLAIAGDGPERSRLEARAREQYASGGTGHASHTIEFLGTVDTARRDALLRQASVVVVPSRITPSGRTEGMPVIALEALAAGVPVVASAVGGLTGLGPAAMLVRPDLPRELAAAIDQTLSEPPDAERLRSAVAHLDWENVAPRLVRSP